MKPRISLILKVLTLVAVTFAGTLVFLFYHNLAHTKKSFMESEREKARIILQTLMPMVSINESFGFGGSIDEQIKEMKRHNPAIVDIIVKRVGDSEKGLAIGRDDDIVESVDIMDYFEPKKQIGTITIHYSNLHYHKLIANYKEDVVYTSLWVVFILVCLSGLLYYSFLPLKKLAADVNDYDFTRTDMVLEPVKSNDEVGDISKAITQLLGRMSGYAKDLKELNETLQDKVDEQTKELRGLNENLQNRIEEAVEKIRVQDTAMVRQSRQAAMGEMIGNIAHQWRQPLNALGLIIQDIKDANNYGELDKEYIDSSVARSMQQIQGMSKTIDDFKNFFKPEKQKAPFHIQSAIEYAQRMVGSRIKHYNIHLDINGEDVEVVGYQNEFAQILINLINNARDAFEERGMRTGGRISIRVKKVDGCVVMEVEDNAGGIPETIMEKIFDPYFTTKDDDKGTGVGLYMSKMIVEDSMNGKLEVANGPDGARFTIILRCDDIA